AASLSVLNPAPTVTTISPATAMVGGAGFTLTVNGTSFLPSSVVRWNGSNRTTSLVNATRLTAVVLASDLATVGPAAIPVVTPAPGGGISGAASFSVLNPVPTITGLAPSTATLGGPGFTVTVTGANFITSSVVHWNGTARTTSFGSSTTLTATIPANDLTTTGTAAVTVV